MEAQPPPIPYILGGRVNYLTLKRVELVGAQPPPIPYILGEMLTPVRIAKGGRRTGAVRIATAFKVFKHGTMDLEHLYPVNNMIRLKLNASLPAVKALIQTASD